MSRISSDELITKLFGGDKRGVQVFESVFYSGNVEKIANVDLHLEKNRNQRSGDLHQTVVDPLLNLFKTFGEHVGDERTIPVEFTQILTESVDVDDEKLVRWVRSNYELSRENVAVIKQTDDFELGNQKLPVSKVVDYTKMTSPVKDADLSAARGALNRGPPPFVAVPTGSGQDSALRSSRATIAARENAAIERNARDARDARAARRGYGFMGGKLQRFSEVGYPNVLLSIPQLTLNEEGRARTVWVSHNDGVPRAVGLEGYANLLITLCAEAATALRKRNVDRTQLALRTDIESEPFILHPTVISQKSLELNVKKNIVNEILAEQFPSSMEEGEECYDMTNISNKWVRKNNRLVREMNINGQIVDVGLDQYATTQKDCGMTGLKLGEEDCQKLLADCFLGDKPGDFGNCVEHLKKTGNFWQTTREQVREMDPQHALKILFKLGFQQREVYDETVKEKLLKVQSVTEWKRQTNICDFGSSQEQHCEILNNENLMIYLCYLVEFINCNPVILNPHVSRSTGLLSTSQMMVSPFLTKLGIGPRIEKNNKHNEVAKEVPRLLHSLRSGTGSYTLFGERPVGVTHRMSINPHLGTRLAILGGQKGGSIMSEQDDFKKTLEHESHSTTSVGSKLLDQIVTNLLHALKTNGIMIDPDDQVKINLRINQLKKLEEELLKTATVYYGLTRVDNVLQYRGRTLTDTDVQRIVDHQKKIDGKKKKNVIDIASICNGLEQLCIENNINVGPQPAGHGFVQ